jgi:hypothetical protein
LAMVNTLRGSSKASFLQLGQAFLLDLIPAIALDHQNTL